MRDPAPSPWAGLVGIDVLRAEAAPGCCLFCGAPVAPKITKPHLTCGAADCRRVYLRLHKRLSRQRAADACAKSSTAIGLELGSG